MVLIEFIRDLVLKNEENYGVVVVYVISVLKDDKVIFIIGLKGKGKLILLLELVSKYGYKFISGDKIFFWMEDGKLWVLGWLDYFYLGFGIFFKYLEFVEYFGFFNKIELVKENFWLIEYKMVIDLVFFKKVIFFVESGILFMVECMIYFDLFFLIECGIK